MLCPGSIFLMTKKKKKKKKESNLKLSYSDPRFVSHALVAQSDVRPPGDQEVAGSIPGPATSYVTGASNWYWLTAGQGLLSS